MDTCRTIGSCVMQPCKACEVCVQAMQLFPDLVKDESRAESVAERFKTFCAGTGRSPIVCDATAAAVAASVAGNLGRRVGALCRSLAECPAQASACQVAAAAGQPAKALDYCSVKGVAGESLEAVASGSKPPNSCKVDGDCSAGGFFCSMATQTRVCSCTNNTGVVGCEMFGTCEKTPCKVCNDCVGAWQTYVANAILINTSEALSASFIEQCRSMIPTSGITEAACVSTRDFLLASKTGNPGRRAGAICSMLGECQYGVKLLCVHCPLCCLLLSDVSSCCIPSFY